MKKMPGVESTQGGRFNPFPGLRPFTPEERDLFFGREGQSEVVLNKLIENRFVTVIGASGSGKSSLVYCGVIPGLIDAAGEDIRKFQVLTMHPGNDPMGSLVSMLAASIPALKQKEIDRAIIDGIIRKDEKGLIDALDKLKIDRDTRSLIIIDQFEEVFRFKGNAQGGAGKKDNRYFMDLLVNAVKDSSSGISIIMTMRSDYVGDCAHFQGLTALINSSNYLIPHMTEDDYRKAIRGPVEYAGAGIENELVDLLISEIGERTDRLPVLQHALMRTWENWESMKMPERPLAVSNYSAIGKMSEAMSRHADEAYEELDEREKSICETLFRAITEKGPDNKGVRRPAKLGTIAAIAGCSERELIKVINVFRSSGRSFLTPAEGIELSGESVIDISHESLMRIWDRLTNWVDREAESERMYLRLSDAAAMFQEGKTTLLRPPDLQLALQWRNENRPSLTWAERYHPAFERAMVYLRTSEKEFIKEEENKIRAQKRQLVRSRVASMFLGLAAVVAVFLMLFAFARRMEAEKNRQVAEQQRKQATELKQEAEDSAERAIRNAMEAEEKEALALQTASEARMTALEALKLKDLASRNAEIARIREERALATADSARMRRLVATGKGMAVRSLQFTGEGDIQVLLAYQAYLFNKSNGGMDNDADIFMGLYEVEKEYGGLNHFSFDGHHDAVHGLAVIPGTQEFCSSGTDGNILRWNLRDRTKMPDRIFEGDEIIHIITTSDNGELLACGNEQANIRIIPASGQGEILELIGHKGRIKSLVFTPDHKKLVSASNDGQVIVWDIEEKEPFMLMEGGEAINSLNLSLSGKYLVAASENGYLHLWNMNDNTQMRSLNTGKGPIDVIRFRDNLTYAAGYQSGLIELRNVEQEGQLKSVTAHSLSITDICFNKHLDQMATSSLDGYVKIWNADDLTEPPVALDDNDGEVYTLAYSDDGRYLLSGSEGISKGRNLLSRASHIDYMAQNMCQLLTRNFTPEEWWRYVGRDIDYRETCDPANLNIRVRRVKGD
jgi:WD40 repeat protein/Na+-transporting methylmalonyl-CoA/oxaloacetate decarboxylase gamma subunit/energy-coupling factor transporter ATP-binding protein EcfA2